MIFKTAANDPRAPYASFIKKNKESAQIMALQTMRRVKKKYSKCISN